MAVDVGIFETRIYIPDKFMTVVNMAEVANAANVIRWG